MKKDLSITLYRVIATVFILICHIGTHYSIGIVAEGFKVGVQMFLLMSGYLAAKNSSKKRNISYYGKRIIRILMPIWCFIIPYLIISCILQMYNPLDFMPYLFGAFGLERITELDLFNSVDGLTHLWYITAALICELVAPLMLYIKNKFTNKTSAYYVISISSIIVLHIFSGIISIKLDYILVFVVGVILFDLLDKQYGFKEIVFYNAFLVMFVVLRVIAQMRIDDTMGYNDIINPLVYLVISYVLFIDLRYFVSLLGENFKTRLQKSKVICFVEKYSFEIYICHYIFIVGPLNVYMIQMHEILKNAMFLVCSMVTAIAVHLTATAINMIIAKKDSSKSDRAHNSKGDFINTNE